jgi:hypothetical protein
MMQKLVDLKPKKIVDHTICSLPIHDAQNSRPCAVFLYMMPNIIDHVQSDCLPTHYALEVSRPDAYHVPSPLYKWK